jgi:NitT/TauT family transport system substrate-binding protein
MKRFRSLRHLAASALLVLAGCGRHEPDAVPAAERLPDAGGVPVRVRLQLDWYPEIESGGYYQAWARGFYAAQGLAVELLPGQPGEQVKETVAEGRADIGATDGNGVIVAISRGLPLVIVGAEMQRNPQALMFHRTRPLNSFNDLDGRVLIASAGAAWVDFLQRGQRVRFDLTPVGNNMANFIADESLVRQCFATQEPYLAEKMGAQVGILMLADAGYDPYRVIYTSRDYAAKHPEVLRRFLEATIAGYEDLIAGDPAPAFAAVSAANPSMDSGLMQHSLGQMRALRLVQGSSAEGERTGRIIRERIAKQIEQLQELGLLAKPLSVDDVARFDLLPVIGVSSRKAPPSP